MRISDLSSDVCSSNLQSMLQPNTHVAEEVGVSEAVVRLIAKPHAEYLNARHRKELRAPRFLGMDEQQLAGSLRAIFIDLEDGWPIELLANHTDLTIKNFLMSLPGRADVEVVPMDMCDRYRKDRKSTRLNSSH